MEKQGKHQKGGENVSFGKKIKKGMATTIGAALIAGASACNGGNGSEMGIIRTQTDESQKIISILTGEQRNRSDVEIDLDSRNREIVSTEEYDNEDGQHIIKKIYEDGSWSTEREDGPIFRYTEYYPNTNKVKFEVLNINGKIN